ncbi:MAG: helix-turn-helix domain-containing protein [Sporichthyaceae bacterium]
MRTEIANSWLRSELSGVAQAIDANQITAAPLVDSGERLRRSVAPVLDTLVQRLASVQAGIVLMDERAVVIDRRGTSSAVLAGFDSLQIYAGSSYGEDQAGTNAAATALEERRPVRIVGQEHYAHMLQQFACYGVPLFQPHTRRMAGSMAIILPESGDHPLFAAVLEDAARHIEALLAGEATIRERAQLECFMQLARRSRGAVFAATEDAVMLNRRAEQFDPVDRASLVRATRGLTGSDHGALLEVGEDLSVRVYTRTDDVEFPGVVLETVAERPRRAGRAAGPAGLPGLAGASPQWTVLCRRARSAAAGGLPVLVTGRIGVGKAAVGRAIHELNGLAEVGEHVFPQATEGWLPRLASQLRAPSTGVVLRHVDLLDERQTAELAAEIDRAGADARVVATAATPSIHPRLASRFPVHVEVPALQDRREDVEPLAKALLSAHSANLRLHQDTLALLRTARLEGNVAELRGLLAAAAAKRRAGDIMPGDLDGAVDVAPRHLTAMQRVEREAIIAALAAAEGNKRTAALRLGISRATLYRRIADFHIDV